MHEEAGVRDYLKYYAELHDICPDPFPGIIPVLDDLAKANVAIVSMEVHKPTLDDVFLSLTGKQKSKPVKKGK